MYQIFDFNFLESPIFETSSSISDFSDLMWARLQVWLIRLIIISTWWFRTKTEIGWFHPKLWFPKTLHIYIIIIIIIIDFSFTNGKRPETEFMPISDFFRPMTSN